MWLIFMGGAATLRAAPLPHCNRRGGCAPASPPARSLSPPTMHRALRRSLGVITLALTLAPRGGAAFQGVRGASPPPASPTPPRREATRRIDSLAHAFVRGGQSPGVTVAVVRAGRDTLLLRGYGLADVENDVPATAQTVYRVGSVTKQFTAAAVMRFVERGRLSLDDTLGALLPGLPAAWRPVRVRQLLNHTSGIPSYTDVGARWLRRSTEDMPPDSLLAFVAGDTMDFAPGTSWHYDNTGYVLLGMLLERLGGRTYAELLDAELFQPLALPTIRYCHTEPIVPHRAHGYARDGDRLVNAPYLSMSQPFGAGVLCATAGDLARWNRLLATGRVVGQPSYSSMTTPEGAARAAPVHYGYALIVDTLGGHRMITHGGAINGFMSANAYFPDDELSVTVLANQAPAPTDALLREIARAALGMPASAVGAGTRAH